MSFDPSDVKHADLHDAAIRIQTLAYAMTLPSSEEFDALEVGMCVKVGVGEYPNPSEAFWVELVAISPLPLPLLPSMLGRIVNHLKFTDKHNLAAGDYIVVHRKNIFAITD
jgi:hypothetical protein